ncbi:hypothetical protein ABOD71_002319 [Salmonella enterica subsp. enterica serovar Kiambu]|uniref:Uncharacterized protein n=1 Tax=Salmonella newport TaxID=108619 RepID=A0A752CCS4_SALNE|nr:hypothetical protein [Salmonella enterica]ECT4794494.1 hypothetical protein [Salmonella enterica subsp. enterica serovar Braenderup]EKQ9811910.1 hypothetical protein [Salmonella enterica subsp. enterica serovar Newport]EBF1800583.1 hypothetical protein [Salmonella enterica]EBR3255645.1 hypothetical protein [Salmonella enterica]
MRMNHMSLNQKWILFSLVLLSPAILAAENLNFNYTRADSLSLEPQLLKLGKVCHSRDDPMDIDVDFLPDLLTSHSRIELIVSGEVQRKGYAGLSVLYKTLFKNPVVDNDLQTAMDITAGGTGSTIYGIYDVTTPKMKTVYEDPFCFSLDTPNSGSGGGYAESNGFAPLYSQAPFAQGYSLKDFHKYCWNFSRDTGGEHTYWPNYYNRPKVVAEGMAKSWEVYQGKYMFYRQKREIQDGTETHQKEETSNVAATKPTHVVRINNSTLSYVFPIRLTDNGMSILRKGNFRLTLSHRNVTSLTLRITRKVAGYDDTIQDFTWKRDGGAQGLSNTLRFTPTPITQHITPAGDIKDDPYAPFYDRKILNGGYFRGTLVAESSLNNHYKNYVKNISPLSLPAKSTGDINLVNTQKLKFVIGQDHQGGAVGGDYTITVFGQPMKFGPLYAGNQEMVSAMQLRDACY